MYRITDVYKRQPEALMKYEEIAGTAVIFYDTDKYDGKVVNLVETPESVSYTHLDVYKRQSI